MENFFKIKQPDGALLFLSNQEFQAFKKEHERKAPSMKIEGNPDRFPCIGFPAYTEVYAEHNSGRKDKKVYAFVYLHADEDEKTILHRKFVHETLNRFECALIMS